MFPKVSILCLSVDSKHYNTPHLHYNWTTEKLHQLYLSPFLILWEIPQSYLLVKVPGFSLFFSEKKIFYAKENERNLNETKLDSAYLKERQKRSGQIEHVSSLFYCSQSSQ